MRDRKANPIPIHFEVTHAAIPVSIDLPLFNCYDRDTRYGNKRSVIWTDYKVHITATCDRDEVYLITNVEIAQAHINDVDQTDKQSLFLLEGYGCVSLL